jgi:hypothetical protein
MMKTLVSALIVLYVLFTIIGCKKDNNNNTTPDVPTVGGDAGTFQLTYKDASLNKDSVVNLATHSATWFTKWNQLYINASSTVGMHGFYAGFVFDPSNPVKRYPLNINGENIANVKFNNIYYCSDKDTGDAGGYFDLTRFDTVKKTISGYLEFAGYKVANSGDRSFTKVKIDDIPLLQDTTAYSGNSASFTFQEKTIANVRTNNVMANSQGWCGSNTYKYFTLGITMSSILFDKPVYLTIPLIDGKGAYPVYPSSFQFVGCGTSYITSRYSARSSIYSAIVQSGSINILNFDTTLRTLNATFNITYRDTATGKMYTITNGQVNLKTWKKYGEQ